MGRGTPGQRRLRLQMARPDDTTPAEVVHLGGQGQSVYPLALPQRKARYAAKAGPVSSVAEPLLALPCEPQPGSSAARGRSHNEQTGGQEACVIPQRRAFQGSWGPWLLPLVPGIISGQSGTLFHQHPHPESAVHMQAACWSPWADLWLGGCHGAVAASGPRASTVPVATHPHPSYRAPATCNHDALIPGRLSLSWIKLPAWPGWCVILKKSLLGSVVLCQPSRAVTGPGKGHET